MMLQSVEICLACWTAHVNSPSGLTPCSTSWPREWNHPKQSFLRPEYTISPFVRRAIRSNTSNASERGAWIETITVRPRRDSWERVSRRRYEVKASRPDVGSSRMSTLGNVTNTHPMDSRLHRVSTGSTAHAWGLRARSPLLAARNTLPKRPTDDGLGGIAQAQLVDRLLDDEADSLVRQRGRQSEFGSLNESAASCFGSGSALQVTYICERLTNSQTFNEVVLLADETDPFLDLALR